MSCSLYNVLYKIISKMLVNRLKVILPHIVSYNQSVFIHKRHIFYNILTTYETLYLMHTRMWGKVGFIALKLDMSKVYDRVEWNFLEEAMRWTSFANKWIELIMCCIRFVKYDILINGQLV